MATQTPPGSSPRKVVTSNGVTNTVKSIDRHLEDVPLHQVDDLWPIFPESTEFHSVDLKPEGWNRESSFQEQAAELLHANCITESRYIETSNLNLEGSRGTGKPEMDAALLFTSSISASTWGDVAVVIECKDRQQRDQAQARRQLKRAAERVFGNQFRLFVWGISVYSSDPKDARQFFFSVYFFTRFGIFGSKEYNLNNSVSFTKFCRLLVGFARMAPHHHGWYSIPRYPHPFVLRQPFPSSHDQKTILHIPNHVEELALLRSLDIKRGIEGRGTHVLLCKTPREYRVVKLVWLSEYRIKRYGAILDSLNDIQGLQVPRTVYHGVLSQVEASDWVENLTAREILRTSVKDSSSLLGLEYVERSLFCVIGDKPGLSIAEEVSLERVFSTFAEIANQIKEMNSRGICHRDVSLANIFTRLLPMEDLREKSEASTTACGWLDDFDCAFHSDISKLSSTLGEGVDRDGALSGTLPFMSEAVLYALDEKLPYTQTAVDDLESLVWVLLWFFYHFRPKAYNKGWEPILYKKGILQSSVTTPLATQDRSSWLIIKERASVSGSQAESPLLQSPANSPLPRKRPSPISSENLQASKRSRTSSKSSNPDPLLLWVHSTRAAIDSKSKIKTKPLSFHLQHWQQDQVEELIDKIWQFPEWEELRPNLPKFRRTAPSALNNRQRKSAFDRLVARLEMTFNNAAKRSMKFYPKAL